MQFYSLFLLLKAHSPSQVRLPSVALCFLENASPFCPSHLPSLQRSPPGLCFCLYGFLFSHSLECQSLASWPLILIQPGQWDIHFSWFIPSNQLKMFLTREWVLHMCNLGFTQVVCTIEKPRSSYDTTVHTAMLKPQRARDWTQGALWTLWLISVSKGDVCERTHVGAEGNLVLRWV